MRSWMAYCFAAALFVATVPMYRYILARGQRPDVQPVTAPQNVNSQPPVEPSPQFNQSRDCATGAVHGPCDEVLAINEALGRREARCLGGKVYRITKQAGVIVVDPWSTSVQCY